MNSESSRYFVKSFVQVNGQKDKHKQLVGQDRYSDNGL